MPITITHLISIAGVVVVIIGTFTGLLMWFVKKSSTDNEKRIRDYERENNDEQNKLANTLEKLSYNIEHINNELHELKVDITGNYVKKTELDNHYVDNKKSHENFWNEIKDMRERMVELETKVSGKRRTRKA